MRWLLYLIVMLTFSISAYASDINILTYRDDYRPLETFQAEIIFDKEPLSELSILNFEFSKNNAIGIILNLEKLSNKRYFVYFDIPNIENGIYKFRVKNVNIIDNGVLRRISEEKPVNVNDINPGFDYLSDNQNNDGSFSDIANTALGALALKNVNSKNADSAISYLINNQDAVGCYPKNNCNVRDSSFALLALSKFNQNYIKTKNWLKDASNNFELGIWNLKLEGNSICGDIQLNGVYNLNIENKNITLRCNNSVKFTLTHNYLGSSYTIYQYTGNNFSYVIDDSGCYGIRYKDKCDYLSTLYASWSLKEINEDFPKEYLKQNKLDNRTVDHALGYILYNENYDKDWLLNNYLNGYWSYYSASLSQEPNYFASAIATYALRDEFLFQEAIDYLNDKTKENIQDSALILYLLFKDERMLPSISINPGIANKKSNFNLRIKNNKEPLTIFIEAPNFTNLPKSIYLENEANYNINANENFEININYGNYSYTIPVISRNQELNEYLPLLPPPRNAIQFLNNDVNLTLNEDDSLADELNFINNWTFRLSDIKLNITGRIKEILEFEQDYFYYMESNETLTTEIYLNKNKNPIYNYYEGYLIVSSSQKTLDAIKLSVKFLGESLIEDYGQEESKQEQEINENEIKTSEEKKSNKPAEKKKSLWWLWVIIILVIGVAVFLFFRRKKEVTESFEDYAGKLKK